VGRGRQICKRDGHALHCDFVKADFMNIPVRVHSTALHSDALLMEQALPARGAAVDRD